MKKKSFKRLHLRRETLLDLQEPALSGLLLARAAAGSNNSDAAWGHCCSTVTSPPIVGSATCEPRTDVCTCSTGPA